MLGISKSHLEKLRHFRRDGPPVVHFGRAVRYPLAGLRAWSCASRGCERMLSADLPLDWNLWCANRTRELRAEGMSQVTADSFAELETSGRVRLAKVIGFEAAAKAELCLTQHANGDDRWYVIVDPDLVPPDAVAADSYTSAGKSES